MKSLLTVAALLAGLASPAMAEEVASSAAPTPATQTQAAVQPAPDAATPAALPQSVAPEVIPMSSPGDMEEATSGKSGGGCSHAKSTVYLTN